MENSSTAAVLTEDVEIETYLLQGEHELKYEEKMSFSSQHENIHTYPISSF